MRLAFLVAWREYAENAKTRGFWISLFMFPLIILISVDVSVLLQTKGTPVRHYILVDQSGQFASVVETRLEKLKPALPPGLPASKAPLRPFQPTAVPAGIDTNATLAALARDLKPWLRGDKNVEADGRRVRLDAAILIPRDIDKQIVRPHARPGRAAAGMDRIEYWSANLADTKLRDEVEQAINGEIRRREYLERGLDSGTFREIEQIHAPFASLNPNKEAGQEAVSGADIIRQWAPSGFVYLLFVAIFTISQMLLNNIIEEKSNRIIEVLLSSVTPGELMMGKLFGIAAVGLTMVGVWMASLFGILSWKAVGAPGAAGQLFLALRTSNLIPMFVVYFLLGYLMFAALILSIGSVCNTIKEAQNYMAVITLSMMVPLLTMAFIPKDPNGTLARVLSWIPLYTPFTMMNRVSAGPPLVDLIGTTILLLASTAAALWMAGKIFRIGILLTGQPPRIVEMLRWIKG
jgi:ABC-2 type transport system permease protein